MSGHMPVRSDFETEGEFRAALRDHFAGQALAGLMGLQTVYDNMADRDVAKATYRLAEAMLAERDKP